MREETKKYITELLTLATKRFPMLPAKPSLTLNDKGDIVLSVIVDGMWCTWIFDEPEVMNPVDEIEEFALAIKESERKRQ